MTDPREPEGAVRPASQAISPTEPAQSGGPAEGTPADGGATTRPRRRRPRRRWHALRETLIVVLAALVISFLVKTFVLQAFWIPSESMEDTLQVGDRVFVTKIQAGPFAIERGDVVVFEDPGGWLPPQLDVDRGPVRNAVDAGLEFVGLAAADHGNHLIKRVVGVEGDHVVCCSSAGNLVVNDVPLDESAYLYPGDEPSAVSFDITVPEGHVWVMGDHRSDSSDSRYHDPGGDGSDGSVPSDLVVGEATVLVWPVDRWNWMIGDGTQVFDAVPDRS